jgi:hypothetical protein
MFITMVDISNVQHLNEKVKGSNGKPNMADGNEQQDNITLRGLPQGKSNL